jgi:hypothetical protein
MSVRSDLPFVAQKEDSESFSSVQRDLLTGSSTDGSR